MAENDTPAENGAAAPSSDAPAATQQAQISQRVLAQYIRDLSFENALAQKGITGDVQPEISVQVNLDARKRTAENQYEIITKLKIASKSKNGGEALFLMELEYGAVFEVKGVPEAQLHPYLLIECPRITFPFVRRIVSDVTRDGGFPPLNLEMIDFLALYRTELARRAQAGDTAAATPQGTA